MTDPIDTECFACDHDPQKDLVIYLVGGPVDGSIVAGTPADTETGYPDRIIPDDEPRGAYRDTGRRGHVLDADGTEIADVPEYRWAEGFDS